MKNIHLLICILLLFSMCQRNLECRNIDANISDVEIPDKGKINEAVKIQLSFFAPYSDSKIVGGNTNEVGGNIIEKTYQLLSCNGFSLPRTENQEVNAFFDTAGTFTLKFISPTYEVITKTITIE